VALAKALGGTAQCTVIGRAHRANMADAALLNGVMAHAIDFDDGHKYVHPGCAVIPAALAVAEAKGLAGADLVAAVAAGYEVSVRVSLAGGLKHRRRGFHPTGTCNVFGAAAAAGRLLGLSADAMASALGIAIAQSAGLTQYRSFGSPTKHLHAGLAARAGVLSALLAEADFQGPPEPLEGEFGFLNVMADGGEAEALTAHLGERLAMEETYIKPYPACRQIHAPLDLAIAAAREHGVVASDIREVVLYTYEYATAGWLVSAAPPQTSLRAMQSMPFCLASALIDGELTLGQVAPDRIAEESTLALARKVIVREDPDLTRAFPEKRGARLEIAMADGRIVALKTDNPKGGPDRPLSFADVVEKFNALAVPVIGAGSAARFVEAVEGLETLDGVGPLVEPLAVAEAAVEAAAAE
jgi:2-methylcitrate dehydratase PrpD